MYKTRMFLLLTLAGCAAPGYRPPEVPVPAAFRETRDTIIEAAANPETVADTASGRTCATRR